MDKEFAQDVWADQLEESKAKLLPALVAWWQDKGGPETGSDLYQLLVEILGEPWSGEQELD